MKPAAVALAISAAACAEPAVEMSLVLPPESAHDLSCVTAVDLVALPVDDRGFLDIGDRSFDDDIPCVELDGPAGSLEDIAASLRGRFELAIPSEGLAGVQLRGRGGRCDEIGSFHEAMFYGGAMYDDGSDALPIRVARNLSCDAQVTRTVRPIDLFTLVRTKECAAPTEAGEIFAADVRPTLLDGDFPGVLLEVGESFGDLGPSGTVALQTFSRSFAGTCPAVAWGGATSGGSVCLPDDVLERPRACAQAGEVELPVVSGNAPFAELDEDLLFGHPVLVFGAVWSNTGTRGPIAGATVTVDEGSEAVIQYLDVGAANVTPLPDATATTASGAFVLHADGVVGLTIAAPGKPTRHIFVGSGTELPGTSLVVLD